jgi:iron complex outermembrane receptor protein
LAAATPAQGQVPDSTTRDSVEAVRLSPLEVTVARLRRPLADLPFAVSDVDLAADLRGRPGDGVAVALRLVPGVLAQHRYNYALGQRIGVRGFGARSAFGVRGVRVLLDGIPQTLPDGQSQLTNVEPAALERLEVLRGVASALWGNGAGGVISLRTAVDRPARASASVRLAAGGRGFRKGLVRMGAPVGDGGLRTTLSWTRVAGEREHSAAELRRASVRLTRPLSPSTSIQIVVHAADDPRLEHPGALTRTEFDSSTTLADPRFLASDAHESVQQEQAALSVRHTGVGGAGFEWAVYGVGRDLESTLPFARIGLARVAWGVRGSGQLPVAVADRRLTLTAGLDAQWQRDERTNHTPDGASRTLDQREQVAEFGPFVSVSAPATARLVLTAGGRLDRIRFRVDDRLLRDGDQSGTRVMQALSWVAGAVLRGPAWLEPYASVGTAFETPTTTELVNRPDGSGGLHPDLVPQQAVSYEVGVRGEGGGARYSVAAYATTVRDALVPFEDSLQPGRRFFRNAGRVRHRGIDVALDVAIDARLRLRGAYSLGDHRFVEFATPDGAFDGNALPGIPHHRVVWSLEMEPGGGWWFALDQEHQTKSFADDANTAVADGFWLAGLRAGWDGSAGGVGLSPFVRVTNLVARRYVTSVVVNARGGRYVEPGPGREVVVGVRARF